MQSTVSWNQGLSDTFKISQGVRQGGVVSPLLYIVYIDELIKRLRQARLGVVVNGNYSGVLAFADDVCLIAESTHELQAMLDIAAKYASDWEYGYNASKSVYMIFSNQDTQTPSEEQLLLGNNPVEYQHEHTYLGITSGHAIRSGMRMSRTRVCWHEGHYTVSQEQVPMPKEFRQLYQPVFGIHMHFLVCCMV